MNYLKPKQEGIKEILVALDQLRNKNLAFFTNTFNYFLQQHPPFENSSIFFDTKNNDFKFICTDQLSVLKPTTINSYKPGDEYTVIKEKTFIYSTIKPLNIIIASANWMTPYLNQINSLNFYAVRDEVAQNFFTWYKVAVNKEILYFKYQLESKQLESIEVKKLF